MRIDRDLLPTLQTLSSRSPSAQRRGAHRRSAKDPSKRAKIQLLVSLDYKIQGILMVAAESFKNLSLHKLKRQNPTRSLLRRGKQNHQFKILTSPLLEELQLPPRSLLGNKTRHALLLRQNLHKVAISLDQCLRAGPNKNYVFLSKPRLALETVFYLASQPNRLPRQRKSPRVHL